jgi:hypothetical protein
MATLLRVVGGIWAVIGAGNIVLMPWGSSASGVLTFGLIFNFVLFVLPGLIVYGIGARMSSRQQNVVDDAAPVVKPQPVEVRLQQLGELKERGLVSESEYATRRAEILREI